VSTKSLNLAIEALNAALNDLNDSFFTITPEKCKSVIFTRRRYFHPSNVFLHNIIIPFVPDVTYLDLTLDPKLRWAPHIAFLSKFLANWSNFRRSVAGTWWGSHLYFSIIRSKLDYGWFLFGSASFSIFNKFNKLQSSCLRTIIGYLRFTPTPAIEVETVCPPFNIRCRWLAGKFLLKSFSDSKSTIFDTFFFLLFNWRYVKKSLPVLSLTTNSLSFFHEFIFTTNLLPCFDLPYEALLYSSSVHIGPCFLGLSPDTLKSYPPSTVNNLFLD